MKQYLQTNWLSSLFTTSISYPVIPFLYHSSISSSNPLSESQEYNNFKKELLGDKRYYNKDDNIDWKMYDKIDQISIYNALFVFAECMHSSLEKKLNRNFNRSHEVIYYAMPYWDKLSNDDKKGWIRRAKAEMNARHNIEIDKHWKKIKAEKVANRKSLNDNQPYSSACNNEKTNSTSNERKKHFLKKKSVSFLLPQYSIRRQKEQNILVKIFKSFDRFSDKYIINDDSNKSHWWSYLLNHNREVNSQNHYYSRKQFIRMSNIDSPLRMKELIWINDRESNNHTYCQPFVPVSQL
ncbi:Pierisin [Dirofilaria immitis]